MNINKLWNCSLYGLPCQNNFNLLKVAWQRNPFIRVMMISVVEPEPPFLAGAGAVKKGAAPAPAQGPAMTPCLKKR